MTIRSVEHSKQALYNQLPVAEAEKLASKLLPHALRTFKTKCEYEPWSDPAYAGKCAYLLCEDDNALPFAAQQHWVQLCNFEFTQTLPTSHCVFLDMPEKTVDIMIGWVKEFGVKSK